MSHPAETEHRAELWCWPVHHDQSVAALGALVRWFPDGHWCWPTC